MQLHSFVCPLFRRGLIIYFDTCRKLSILLVCACDVESRGLFSFLLNVKIHDLMNTLSDVRMHASESKPWILNYSIHRDLEGRVCLTWPEQVLLGNLRVDSFKSRCERVLLHTCTMLTNVLLRNFATLLSIGLGLWRLSLSASNLFFEVGGFLN